MNNYGISKPLPYRFCGNFVLLGRKCTLSLQEGARTIYEGNTQLFCGIDAIAVSMPQKFCGFAEGIQLAVGMHAFLSKATVPLFNVTYFFKRASVLRRV